MSGNQQEDEEREEGSGVALNIDNVFLYFSILSKSLKQIWLWADDWFTRRTGKTLIGGLKRRGREDQNPEGWGTQLGNVQWQHYMNYNIVMYVVWYAVNNDTYLESTIGEGGAYMEAVETVGQENQ